MKLKYSFLLALVLVSLNLLAQKADTITIVSYNIHHGNPPAKPGVIDLDAIANVLANEKPDFVALQEVDVNINRSGNVNQAEYLAKKLNMYFYFAKAIDHDGGDYGVAVLSKYPISEQHSLKFSRIEGLKAEDRVLAVVSVKLGNGKKITFGSTHLDHQKDEALRLLQVSEIVKYAENEKGAFIVAGDFNAVPSSATIQLLDKSFIRTCDNCGFTIPVVTPKRAIDFIAFKPNRKISIFSHEVIQEHQASDHLPIVAKIILK
ncbi:endonuclease/exonuclease/phosphatase family protein [Pedobacter chitinilyticus]|uniref:Endonuclease/exonuclease/phosphatase n=1 Tax=Pedobacter chitinilyticus TaxID=2233776 RepID=A0A443YVB0_9SPHI|nr:endonuclease/exonuclease/phosphatase family protein [Pedobacter chitinilyticus]RWU07774.1 endonuclease/exonuclease/phosphatase [Pedobacter chitinilyticus]